MTNLTPQKRAELRALARVTHRARRVTVWSHELLALLDAADERDRLAAALARAQGPFACCPHCKEDKIHDVETNGHEVPCTKCQASIGEIERLRSERDRLAAAIEEVQKVVNGPAAYLRVTASGLHIKVVNVNEIIRALDGQELA